MELSSFKYASRQLQGQILRTPFVYSQTLSELTGCQLFLKFENLQFTASFKERGAYTKLSRLSPVQRDAGVIAVSAGNHAQGVAYHAQRLGIHAVIVMPSYTPAVKVQRTEHFGAEIVLAGDTFDEARRKAITLAEERGLTWVHPYDDLDIICGQGTVGLEMLEDVPSLDALVIAIGGGGLIAGSACAAKQIKPGIQVYGVQTEQFPHMVNAIKGTQHPGGRTTIAEGIAVSTPGQHTRKLIEQYVDDLLLVSEGEIEQSLLYLLDIEKTIVEGAGAAGLAAILRYPDYFKGKQVGVVLCGGNVDPLLLADMIKRGMVRLGRLARLNIAIHDRPGALAKITQIIADQQANIEEVMHQRAFTVLPAQNAELEVVIQTRNRQQIDQVLQALQQAGFPATLQNHH
ncbi:threonine ammonia-lyase [Parvibium lacunae]|uniref:Threonine ammonia-lyase n=1 Tax=Parvibium lacunae TaxID=1888893 RepID=A0A368L864_9BURK|nr:threonine ammonia-lyase [Parvibium lacunae]RCS59794.1 threonine ammonia-lyase [Parvibium lacunae]